jgi:hypothetical protein
MVPDVQIKYWLKRLLEIKDAFLQARTALSRSNQSPSAWRAYYNALDKQSARFLLAVQRLQDHSDEWDLMDATLRQTLEAWTGMVRGAGGGGNDSSGSWSSGTFGSSRP